MRRSAPEVGCAQRRISEVGVGEVGAKEVGVGEVGAREVGVGEVGVGEVGIGEVGAGEVGVGEVGAGEVGVGEVGAGEVGAREVSDAEVGVDEVGAGEVGTDEIGVGEAALVRSAPVRLAPVSLAPVRSAAVRLASASSATLSSTPSNRSPIRAIPRRSMLEKGRSRRPSPEVLRTNRRFSSRSAWRARLSSSRSARSARRLSDQRVIAVRMPPRTRVPTSRVGQCGPVRRHSPPRLRSQSSKRRPTGRRGALPSVLALTSSAADRGAPPSRRHRYTPGRRPRARAQRVAFAPPPARLLLETPCTQGADEQPRGCRPRAVESGEVLVGPLHHRALQHGRPERGEGGRVVGVERDVVQPHWRDPRAAAPSTASSSGFGGEVPPHGTDGGPRAAFPRGTATRVPSTRD